MDCFDRLCHTLRIGADLTVTRGFEFGWRGRGEATANKQGLSGLTEEFEAAAAAAAGEGWRHISSVDRL